jgi:glycosyltransferase involved in cell wall biosynthesis
VSAYAKDLASGPIFREVWVVSEFVRQAFITAGVAPERVVTIRPMLTSGFWKMGDVDEMATQKSQRPVSNDDRFVFGTLGTWQKRKGMFDLIRAYFREFKREEPVTLVIRTSPLNSSMTIRKFKTQVTEEVAAIAREFRDNDFPRSQKMPKLQFELGTDLTDQGVIDWLGTLDCYVNPSYGEGLGIPHVWAKAQGVPMVTSDYGAVGQMMFEIADAVGDLSDFVFPSIDTPVDPEMLKLGLMFERATRWGTYDVANLSTSMRLATQRGRRVETAHAHYVRNAFGPDALGPLRTALRRLLPEKAQEWL